MQARQKSLALTVKNNSGPIEQDPAYVALLNLFNNHPDLPPDFVLEKLADLVDLIKADRAEAIAASQARLDSALQVYEALADACDLAMSEPA